MYSELATQHEAGVLHNNFHKKKQQKKFIKDHHQIISFFFINYYRTKSEMNTGQVFFVEIKLHKKNMKKKKKRKFKNKTGQIINTKVYTFFIKFKKKTGEWKTNDYIINICLLKIAITDTLISMMIKLIIYNIPLQMDTIYYQIFQDQRQHLLMLLVIHNFLVQLLIDLNMLLMQLIYLDYLNHL